VEGGSTGREHRASRQTETPTASQPMRLLRLRISTGLDSPAWKKANNWLASIAIPLPPKTKQLADNGPPGASVSARPSHRRQAAGERPRIVCGRGLSLGRPEGRTVSESSGLFC